MAIENQNAQQLGAISELPYPDWLEVFVVELRDADTKSPNVCAFEVSPAQWCNVRRDCIDGKLSIDGKKFMGLTAVVKRDAQLKFLDFIPSNAKVGHGEAVASTALFATDNTKKL